MRPLRPLLSFMLLALIQTTLSLPTACAQEEYPSALSLPKEALQDLAHLAIQHGGRHKPFDSFARETLRSITGAPHLGKQDPVATILSIVSEPERWQEVPLLSVPFVPLREALGLHRKVTHLSYNDLISARKLMRMLPPIVEKQQRDEKLTMLEVETMDLYDRFVLLNSFFQQELTLVPPPRGQPPGSSWLPILDPQGYPPDQREAIRTTWMTFIETLKAGQPQAIITATEQLKEGMHSANPVFYPAPWRLRLEVLYNHLAPFKIARALYGVASLSLGLALIKMSRLASSVGMGALWVGFLVHGTGILLRVVLGERPPVSNFYETMLWLPFVAVMLALVFERIEKVGHFGLAASILSAIVLALVDRLPLDPSISPVVAVLRSNLWLTVHVLTIVASYGALALSTVIAHLYGWFVLVRGDSTSALESVGWTLYRSIQVGVVLLAAGIMLGAVWANASWGRYWGWDPKETWALITLLWFLAILHGRFAGWLKGVGVALSTIAGFFLLLMTYYGVSFYLVGLHSYAGGHAKPLPPALIGYLVLEIAFMVAVALRTTTLKSLKAP